MEIDETRASKRPGATEGGFEPPPPKLIFKPRTSTRVRSTSVPVSNQFSELREETDPVASTSQTGSTSAKPATKPEKPSPIIIRPAISQVSIRKHLRTLGITDFTTSASDKETRLYLKTLKEQAAVVQLLRESKGVEFHYFAPRGTKRSKKYILHGFDLEHPIAEITEELSRRLPGYRMARRLTRKLANGQYTETELIQIITNPEVRIQQVAALGAVNQVRIRVSHFKDDGAPAQCRNCMEYGHVMKYCGRTCACPWCGADHILSHCPKKQEQQPVCVLCKGNHPANSKECPTRTALIKKRRETVSAAPVNAAPIRKPSRLVDQDVEYSTLLGGKPSQSGAHPHHQQAFSHHQTVTSHYQPTKHNHQDSTPTTTSTSVTERLLLRIDQMMDMMNNVFNLLTTILQK